jgi:hypothetical protein
LHREELSDTVLRRWNPERFLVFHEIVGEQLAEPVDVVGVEPLVHASECRLVIQHPLPSRCAGSSDRRGRPVGPQLHTILRRGGSKTHGRRREPAPTQTAVIRRAPIPRNARCSVCGVTRFVVDCETLLHIAAGEIEVAAGHTLVAPTLVRSQALSALYGAAGRGEISAAQGIERVTRINSLKVRFLGDKVLQRTAWKVADQLGGR